MTEKLEKMEKRVKDSTNDMTDFLFKQELREGRQEIQERRRESLRNEGDNDLEPDEWAEAFLRERGRGRLYDPEYPDIAGVEAAELDRALVESREQFERDSA